MISINKLKKIDADLSSLSDNEVAEIRSALYELGQLAFDDWYKKQFGSKNPIGSLNTDRNERKI